MNLTISELIAKLVEIQRGQSPHLPTNIFSVSVVDRKNDKGERLRAVVLDTPIIDSDLPDEPAD